MRDTIEQTVYVLETLLAAAKDVQSGIESKNVDQIRAGLRTFDDHTDGYWHKLVVSRYDGDAYGLFEAAQEEALGAA